MFFTLPALPSTYSSLKCPVEDQLFSPKRLNTCKVRNTELYLKDPYSGVCVRGSNLLMNLVVCVILTFLDNNPPLRSTNYGKYSLAGEFNLQVKTETQISNHPIEQSSDTSQHFFLSFF